MTWLGAHSFFNSNAGLSSSFRDNSSATCGKSKSICHSSKRTSPLPEATLLRLVEASVRQSREHRSAVRHLGVPRVPSSDYYQKDSEEKLQQLADGNDVPAPEKSPCKIRIAKLMPTLYSQRMRQKLIGSGSEALDRHISPSSSSQAHSSANAPLVSSVVSNSCSVGEFFALDVIAFWNLLPVLSS
ncbi:unnamed protein product [Protopolystoma xenopodis]|uniref:Uncharacterized protein n=1 Tax=Protopolystoma xenopodis TaxID=117903 RepID=A0A3S5A4X7_9PLAT|nr:unnamed protein product [Protopolystoma xenopodis]